MKNIHVLPTNKPSRLHFDGKLFLSPNYQDSKTINSIVEGRNIYITNDEEIKEGDWYALFTLDKTTKWETTKLDCVVKADLNKTNEYLIKPFSKYCKKIILTTDIDLIKDNVQAIPDEFLEWFVKNPTCNSVKVQWIKTPDGIFYHQDNVPYGCYKIIIPKEEKPLYDYGWCKGNVVLPQEPERRVDICYNFDKEIGCIQNDCRCEKAETIEEVAENFSKQYFSTESDTSWEEQASLTSFIAGAKWQAERMYSEEDIINALHSVELKDNKDYSKIYNGMKEWFEQFKKK